jgi:hypothetical protein
MTVLLDVSKELIASRIKDMAEIDELINKFESTAQFEIYQAAKKKRKRLEGEVREIAVDCFGQTEAKHPHAAVSIKMRTVFDWDDDDTRHYCIDKVHDGDTSLAMIDPEQMDDVIMYLAESDELGLIANDKAFTKHIKTLDTKPDFVTETKEPYANIAKDLSEFAK